MRVLHADQVKRDDVVRRTGYDGTTITGKVVKVLRHDLIAYSDETGKDHKFPLHGTEVIEKGPRHFYTLDELTRGEREVRAIRRMWRGPRCGTKKPFEPKPYGMGDWVRYVDDDGVVWRGQLASELLMVVLDHDETSTRTETLWKRSGRLVTIDGYVVERDADDA